MTPEPRLGEFEGWKAVRVGPQWRGKAFTGAHFVDKPYTSNDRAVCEYHTLRDPDHILWRGDGSECCCGFYALKTMTDFNMHTALTHAKWNCELTEMVAAVAHVSLWGRVVEGTGGWRAEYQRIDELRVEHWDVRRVKRALDAAGEDVHVGSLTGGEGMWT